MADLVGKQLGKYRLTSLLGRGGFAEVYRGEHIYLKSQAAIKVLRIIPRDEEVKSFLTEAQELARLQHSLLHLLPHSLTRCLLGSRHPCTRKSMCKNQVSKSLHSPQLCVTKRH
jgi:serine/threonine protein kinase